MRRVLVSVGAGVLGFTLAWGGWHLWLDHLNLHALVQLASQPMARPAGAPK